MARSGKGSAWEREICRELSSWWSGGSHDDLFWRTSQSGGRMTSRAKVGKSTRAHCGDIAAVDALGIPLTSTITFELKRGYPKADPIHLLDKPKRAAKQLFQQFLDQAVAAAERANTPFWILLHKRDMRDPVLYMPEGLLHLLSEKGVFFWNRIDFKLTKDCLFSAVRLSYFLKKVSPDIIRTIYLERNNP